MAIRRDKAGEIEPFDQKLFRWLRVRIWGGSLSVVGILVFLLVEISIQLPEKWQVFGHPSSLAHYWIVFLILVGILFSNWTIRDDLRADMQEMRERSDEQTRHVNSLCENALNDIAYAAGQKLFIVRDSAHSSIWAGFKNGYLAYNPTFGMDIEPTEVRVDVKLPRVRIHSDRYGPLGVKEADYLLYQGKDGEGASERLIIRNFLIFMHCVESQFVPSNRREIFLSQDPDSWIFKHLGSRVSVRLLRGKRTNTSYFLGTKSGYSGSETQDEDFNFGIIYVAPDSVLSKDKTPRMLIGVKDQNTIARINTYIDTHIREHDEMSLKKMPLDEFHKFARLTLGVKIPLRKHWNFSSEA